MPATRRRAIRSAAKWAENQAAMEAIYGVGGYYTTISAWVAAEVTGLDLVALDRITVAECYNDFPGGIDEQAAGTITIDCTSNASCYPVIRVMPGHRHNGRRGTGFFIWGYTGTIVSVTAPFMQIDGLEIQHTKDSNGYNTAIVVNAEGVTLRDGVFSSSNVVVVLDSGQWDGVPVRAINCLVLPAGPARTPTGITGGGGYSRSEAINCIAGPGCGTGFDDGGYGFGTRAITLINCVAVGCTNLAYTPGTFDPASKNNAAYNAETTTPPGTNPVLKNITSADFENLAARNFKPSRGSALRGRGAIIDADYAREDLYGNVRPREQSWDIGTSQYVDPDIRKGRLAGITLRRVRTSQPQERITGFASDFPAIAGFIAAPNGAQLIGAPEQFASPNGTGVNVAVAPQGYGVGSTSASTNTLRLHSVGNVNTVWARPTKGVSVAVLLRRFGNTGGNSPIFMMGAASTAPYTQWGIIDGGGSGIFRFELSPSGSYSNLDGGSIPNNEDVVLVCTYDGTYRRMYLRGIEVVFSLSAGGDLTTVSDANSGPAAANFWNFTGSARSFNGRIYGGILHDAAWTPEQVRRISTPAGFWSAFAPTRTNRALSLTPTRQIWTPSTSRLQGSSLGARRRVAQSEEWKTRTTQPRDNPKLDTEHWARPVFVFNGAKVEGVTAVSTPRGLSALVSDTGVAGSYTGPVVPISSAKSTVIILLESPARPNVGDDRPITLMYGTSDAYIVQSSSADYRYATHHGGNSGSITTNAGPRTPAVWAFVSDGVTLNQKVNGQSLSNFSYGGDQLNVQVTFPSNGTQRKVLFAAICDATLTDAKIAEIAANPWQLFAKERITSPEPQSALKTWEEWKTPAKQPRTTLAVRPELSPIAGIQPGGFGLGDTNGQALTFNDAQTSLAANTQGVTAAFSSNSATGLTRACSVSSFPLTFVFSGSVSGISERCLTSLAISSDKTIRVFGNAGTCQMQRIGNTTYSTVSSGGVWTYGSAFTLVAVVRSDSDASIYVLGPNGYSEAHDTTNVGTMPTLTKLAFGVYDGSVKTYAQTGHTNLAQWLTINPTPQQIQLWLRNPWAIFNQERVVERNWPVAIHGNKRTTPRTSQPQGAARIGVDRLDFLDIGPTSPASQRVTASTEYGRVTSHAGAFVDRSLTYTRNPEDNLATTPWTVAGVAVFTNGGGSNYYGPIILELGTNRRVYLNSTVGAKTLSAYLYDSGTKYVNAANVPLNTPVAFVATTDGSVLYLTTSWAAESSVAVVNCGQSMTGNTVTVNSIADRSNGVLANMGLLVRTNSYWSKNERDRFIANPWQLFASRKSLIWTPAP